MSTVSILLIPVDKDIYRTFWWCKTHDEIYFLEHIPCQLSEKTYGVKYLQQEKGPCNDEKDTCSFFRLGTRRFSDDKLVCEYITDPKELGSQKYDLESLDYCERINEKGEFVEFGINIK